MAALPWFGREFRASWIIGVVATAALAWQASAVAGEGQRCLGERATIVGDDTDETLVGGPGNDLLEADDGVADDRLRGGPELLDTCLFDAGDDVAGCEL